MTVIRYHNRFTDGTAAVHIKINSPKYDNRARQVSHAYAPDFREFYRLFRCILCCSGHPPILQHFFPLNFEISIMNPVQTVFFQPFEQT